MVRPAAQQPPSRNQRGAILTLALVFGAIFAIILAGLWGYLLTQYRANIQLVAKEQALHIAESGLEYYHWYLAHVLEGMSELEQEQFWSSGATIGYPEPYLGQFADQYGTIVGQFQLDITPPLPGGNAAVIRSTGWTTEYPSVKRVAQNRRRKPSWSEYVILINHRANLPEGMIVKGKAHSNEDLRVDGVIHNLATASETTHPDPITEQEITPGVWTTKDPENVFLAGREDNVPIIDFNALAGKLDTLKNLTYGSNYYLPPPQKTCWPASWLCLIEIWNPSGHLIRFKNDSTIDLYRTRGLGLWGLYLQFFTGLTYAGNFPWPQNRLIFSEATAWVEGEINSHQITVAAANLVGADLPGANNLADIIIRDDLTYQDNDAVLGLIAQDNIMIDKNAGDPDLDINAALIAQGGQIGREDFGNSLGDLTINGSLAANYLGNFYDDYCLWAWCWAQGFEDVELNYDNRLLYNPPPYFPTKENFQTDMWEELE